MRDRLDRLRLVRQLARGGELPSLSGDEFHRRIVYAKLGRVVDRRRLARLRPDAELDRADRAADAGGGGAAYGGTPSDASVVRCIRDLKARGFKVVFYPFLLMTASGYPWRGQITPCARLSSGGDERGRRLPRLGDARRSSRPTRSI